MGHVKKSPMTVEEVRAIWALAINIRKGETPLKQADAMHELRKTLSYHCYDWVAENSSQNPKS